MKKYKKAVIIAAAVLALITVITLIIVLPKSEKAEEPSESAVTEETSVQSSAEPSNEPSKQESSKQENSKVKADTSLKITDDTAFGQGDENDDIKKIQKRLKELGYGKFEDGITNYFGEMTAKAFKQFQKNNGLDDDGYAGADALRLLFSDKVKPASASSQSSQQETTEQQ